MNNRQASGGVPGKTSRYILWLMTAAVIMAAAVSGAGGSVPAAADPPDFTEFSLEELKSVKITSASRTPEKLSDIPAAVFVITQDDIRRSGATSIPEVLRMAPGVQVARISATEWAVNIRGLNELYSNKLLVLIDGRSIYTHVFSGVFWDIHDTVMEDIDRIEVIRGPGASVWGVNAVNGVINIITKHSGKTQGGQLTALGGTEEGAGSLRYGGTIGDAGYYRVYGKVFSKGKLFEGDRNIQNDPSKSDWFSGRGGFRIDWEPDDPRDTVTVQGEAFFGRYDSTENTVSLETPYYTEREETLDASGGHLIGRWDREFSRESDAALQVYYDYYDKEVDSADVRVHTMDLDFQHRFSFIERNEIVWGLNGRFISDRFSESPDLLMAPTSDDQFFYGLFIQDKVQLIPGYASLTVGSKFEHNDDTGWEIQPTARLMWTPGDAHAVWAAVSRAARVPSRVEKDTRSNILTLPPGKTGDDLPILVRSIGGEELEVESLIAYELGYQFQPTGNLWINMSGFFQDYKDLISLRFQESVETENTPVEHQVLSLSYDNRLTGESYGIEMAVFWQATRFWKLQGAYSFLETRFEPEFGNISKDLQAVLKNESNPRNQMSLRSSLEITSSVEMDCWLRYVDRLTETDVDDYTTLDARVSWKPTPLMEVSLVGQNLLEDRHAEFSSLEIERSVYLKLDWCF